MILALAVFHISCNNDFHEIEKNENFKQEANPTNKYAIGIETAIKIASQALNDLNDPLVKSRSNSNYQTVKQVITYPVQQSRSSKSNLYIINFEGGGFAIVPADNRATDVYAMSDDGEFNLENEGSAYFMELAEAYLNEEINNASSNEPEISTTSLDPIPPPDGGPEMYVIVEFNGKEYYWNSITTQTTPFYLLETNWHQGNPYRHFCFTNEGEDAVAGCVPIAMAQIMAYHKRPVSFNGHYYEWNFLTENPTISETSWLIDNVGYLVHDIGENVNVQYGVEESGAYNEDAVETFRNFGYSATLDGTYDFSEIKTSLDNSNPVYISGTRTSNESTGHVSHAWVLDGYYIKTTVDEYYDIETLEKELTNTTYSHYLHCNWGWAINTSYCLSGIFTVGSYNYNHNFNLIYVQ